MTIEQRLDPRDNALNLVRWTLAALVIFDHTFPLGYGERDPQILGVTWAHYVVVAFFVISGYLITMSRFQSGLVAYAWRRFLRIVPAFWVCLVFTAFVAAAYGGSVNGGWTASSAAEYVWTSLNFYNYTDLPAQTLNGMPHPITWNGSLWTLRFEVFFYVVLGIAMSFPWLRRQRAILAVSFVIVTAWSIWYHLQYLGTDTPDGPISAVAYLFPAFLAGATLYRYADRIPLNGLGAVIATFGVVVSGALDLERAISALPLAYLMVWIGVVLPRGFRKLASRNDYSYGLYVYSYPVMQILVLAGATDLGQPVFLLLAFLFSIPMSIASWFLIEKPAMRLKTWGFVARLDSRFSAPREPVGADK